MAHLEALEILSTESSNKVQIALNNYDQILLLLQLETSLSVFTGQDLIDIKEIIDSIAQYFTIEDDDDNDEEGNLIELKHLLKGFNGKLKVDKVLQVKTVF